MDRKQYLADWYLRNHERLLKKSKDYNVKHKEKKRLYDKNYQKFYSKEYFNRCRLEVLIHYGGNPPKCACCDESNVKFLTIDHINGGGAKQRKQVGGGFNFYRWLIRNNFPEGYQVLCFNCNCGRAKNNGVCPHKDTKKP